MFSQKFNESTMLFHVLCYPGSHNLFVHPPFSQSGRLIFEITKLVFGLAPFVRYTMLLSKPDFPVVVSP